ncbi:MAG: NADH-quinone oxidoreductase subunit N [Acidimicrobiales bacterium]|nr:NADH-quinone oxidoreductase subunit N [Acidimicrobiales bacterium]
MTAVATQIGSGLSGVLAQLDDVAPVPLETPEIVWSALLPLLILAGGAIVVLTVASLIPFMKRPGAITAVTVLIGAASLAACVPVWQRVQDPDRGPLSVVAGAIGVDGFTVVATGLIAASVILGALLLHGYVRREEIDGPEMYVLMLLSASGGAIMASANDLIVMFLGLEALSIAVYVMASMHRKRAEAQEAGFKYFILGAFASAFFLYGIAMVYGATGSTNLVEIASFLSSQILLTDGLLMVGMALLLVGFGFKVAAVPFHSWTPDVYQGAPTPVTAFMAAAVKVGAFAAIVRVLYLALGTHSVDWQPVIYVLAVLSLVVGAVLAVVQTDVRRMLAYSSISHAGFLLVGIQAATAQGVEAMLFYLVAYSFMVMGSFGVVGLVTRRGDAASSLDDFRGLSRSRPVLALAFTVFLLSQAGVPATSGFFAKFYVIGAAVDARSYWLALAAMLASVIAAVLYLKIIVSMYLSGDEGEEVEGPRVAIPGTAAVALVAAIAVTLVVGVLPNLLLDLLRDATPVLVAF